MDTARNAPPAPPPAPDALPVPVRRAIGSVLLFGTMWLAGALALVRAVWTTFS